MNSSTMTTNLTDRARKLRKDSTDAERLLWNHLKAKQMLGLKFRRQEQIGHYIADFVCYETSLIIEADGGQHNENRDKDDVRTHWLNSQGFRVLRFWNNDILTNSEGVLDVIRRECSERLSFPFPSSLPQGERGLLCFPSLDISNRGEGV